MLSFIRNAFQRGVERAGEKFEDMKERATIKELRYYIDWKENERLRALLGDARDQRGIDGARALSAFKMATTYTTRARLGLSYAEENNLTAARHLEAAEEHFTESISAIPGPAKYAHISYAYRDLMMGLIGLDKAAFDAYMTKVGHRIMLEYEKLFEEPNQLGRLRKPAAQKTL